MIEIRPYTGYAIEKMRQRYSALSDYRFEIAVNRAINRTLTVSRTEASSGIRKVYDIQAKFVRKALTIEKANRRNFTGKLIATGRPIPLKEFKPRQTRKGVTVSIKKGAGRQLINSAFIPKLPSGAKAVFARGNFKRKSFEFRRKRVTSAGGYRYDEDNLKYQPINPDSPMKQLTSLSVPKAFMNSQVEEALSKKINSYFPDRLIHELNYIISKSAPQ